MQRLTLTTLCPLLLTACPTPLVPTDTDADTESTSSGETMPGVTLTASATTPTDGLPSTSATTSPPSTSADSSDSSDSSDSTGATDSSSSDSGTEGSTSSSTGDSSTTESNALEGCDEIIKDPLPLTLEGDVEGAGDDHPARVPCLIYVGGEDVSYGWVVPEDGLYRIDTLGARLTIADGCTEPANVVACDTPVRYVYEIDLAEGTELALIADSYSPNSGKGAFEINIERTECDDAVDLGSDSPLSVEVSIDGDDDLSGSCGTYSFQNYEENVFTWTAPATGMYEFSTGEDGIWIYAYLGTCGDYRDELGCSAESFTAAVSAGDTVYVVVDGGFFADDTGMVNITQVGDLTGDCCTEHFGAGCEDPDVTNCLCSEWGLPFPLGDESTASCCTGDWEPKCVSAAAALGCAACEQVDGGSCCIGDDTEPEPGCDVESIETCVCDYYPDCCGFQGWGWDSLCAYVAQVSCGAAC